MRGKRPEINPETPWADDGLARADLAARLTRLLSAELDGVVVSLDGEWGSGKTFFVERWCQSISATHPTVYFNAWESDFGDDPLVALASQLTTQLKSVAGKTLARKLMPLRERTAKIVRGAGAIAARALVRKALGDEGLKDVRNLADPATEEEFVERIKPKHDVLAEHERIAKDIKACKSELAAVVEALAKDENGRKAPLFVFVDEVDRCRPTYAIQLLERIKHVLDVPGVVFVLVTNLEQLANSVKGVYGAEFDGDTYLYRFFDQRLTLPSPEPIAFARHLVGQHPDFLERIKPESLWLPRDTDPAEVIGGLADDFQVPLRHQEQWFGRMRAVLRSEEFSYVDLPLLAVFGLIQQLRPDLLLQFSRNRITLVEILQRWDAKGNRARESAATKAARFFDGLMWNKWEEHRRKVFTEWCSPGASVDMEERKRIELMDRDWASLQRHLSGTLLWGEVLK